MHVIIIGTGIGWELAPLEGNTWGVNDLCSRRPVKVVFNLHKDFDGLKADAINTFVNVCVNFFIV